LGIPIWFVFNILLTFSPEVSQAINKGFIANPAISLMLGYIGVSLGDILEEFGTNIRSTVVILYLISLEAQFF
jgi:hypothetical protein